MGLIPLGILSSAGGGFGTYELIQTQILGTAAASITFSGLSTYASVYKHLQLRVLDRQSTGASEGYGRISFNGVTTNQVSHLLYATGSGVFSIYDSTRIASYGIAATDTANVFTARVIDILDAFSSTKNKTLRMLYGNEATSNKRIVLESGLWSSTAAISSVTMTSQDNYVTGSRFSIYGIR
jgi:hypothetical protein